MVLSDALPKGFIARPTLPSELLGFDTSDTEQRKKQKGKKWLPLSVLSKPLNQWATEAKAEDEMMATFLSEKEKEENERKNKKPRYIITDSPQDHNSLNRQTGTTGEGDGFAPFQLQTFWYHPEVKLDIFIELDEARFSLEQLTKVLQFIGESGYGKEASCGLGKFEIVHTEPVEVSTAVEGGANAWLTLAACAPQGLAWDSTHCYYSIFTRFGRHGDKAVHHPFKNPVLLAAPFALLTPKTMNPSQGFTGQGITGVSKTIQQTVQQGYAPVLSVQL